MESQSPSALPSEVTCLHTLLRLEKSEGQGLSAEAETERLLHELKAHGITADTPTTPIWDRFLIFTARSLQYLNPFNS